MPVPLGRPDSFQFVSNSDTPAPARDRPVTRRLLRCRPVSMGDFPPGFVRTRTTPDGRNSPIVMAVRISVRREGGVCTNGKERNHSRWGVGRDNGGARPLRAAKPDPAVRRTATRLPGSRLARPRGGIAKRGSQSPTETRLSSRFPGSPSPNGLGSLGQLTVADFNTGVLSRAVGKFCKRGAPDARPGGLTLRLRDSVHRFP